MLRSRFCFYRVVALSLLHLSTISVVSTIMVRERWLEMYKAQQLLENRHSIADDCAKRQNQRKTFWKSLPCISKFLEQHIDPSRSSFLLPDVLEDTPEIIRSFTSDLRLDVAFYTVNSEIKPQGRYRSASSAVILTESATDLNDTTTYLLDLCGRDCNFVVIFVSEFSDEESFLEEADTMVEVMWTHWVARVVVLGPVGDSVLLAGSLSYVPEEPCTPSPPILLGRCEGNAWKRFKEIQELSLNGCIVNLAYYDIHPYAYAENSTEQLDGIEGTMVEQIMRTLNSGLNRQKIVWTGNVSLVDEMHQLVSGDAKVDLIIGGMLWSADETVDYTRTYETARIVWLVPQTPNVSLRGLITPFTANVWAAICGVLLLGGLVRTFLIRDISCLDLTALLLGVSASRQPWRPSSRIVFISWSIFGFLLVQFYLGSLADQLMTASDVQIDTMSDLVAANYKLGGTSRLAELFFDGGDEEGDETIKEISDEFVIFDHSEYLKQLADLIEGRNSTVALVAMLNVSHSLPMDTKHVHLLKETMGNYPIALAVWKGLPYLERINSKIQDLIESGIVGFWADRIALSKRHYDSADSKNSGELLFWQFTPAFLLLIIGFCTGFCFFVIEVLGYPSKWLE